MWGVSGREGEGSSVWGVSGREGEGSSVWGEWKGW